MRQSLLFFLILITILSNGQFLDDNIHGDFNASLDCHVNINCNPAWLNAIYRDKIARSVVKIDGVDYGGCSGTLVRQWGKSANDQEPLILTAKHCIRNVNLDNLVFIFNYQSPNCDENSVPNDNRGSIFPANIWACNTLNTPETPNCHRYIHVGGATLIDQSDLPDFALLKLNNPIPPHFLPYYAGWTINPVQLTIGQNFTGIHHPRGDIKKVSRTNSISRLTFRVCLIPFPFSPFCLLYGIFTSPFYYKVDFWTYGTTEVGSSGSALFNSSERIIGMLSHNQGDIFLGNDCDSPAYDYYAAFDMSWAVNKGLRDALNPTNALIGGCNGTEVECYRGDLRLKGEYFPAGEYQPNNVITLRAENNIIAADASAAGLPGVDNLRIYPNADFTFRAGGNVVLQHGFVAEMGSHFVAEAGQPCNANREIPEEPEYISETQYQEMLNRAGQSLAELKSYGINPEQMTNNLPEEVYVYEQIVSENEENVVFNHTSDFHLYPNPVQDVLKIQYALPSSNTARVVIYDMYMRIAEEFQINSQTGIKELDISHLPQGVYFCELQTPSQRILKRLVKQ